MNFVCILLFLLSQPLRVSNLSGLWIHRMGDGDLLQGLKKPCVRYEGLKISGKDLCQCEDGKTFYNSEHNQRGCYGTRKYKQISGCRCYFEASGRANVASIQRGSDASRLRIHASCRLLADALISNIFVWNPHKQRVWDGRWSDFLKQRISYSANTKMVTVNQTFGENWGGLLLAIDFEQYNQGSGKLETRYGCALLKISGIRTYPLDKAAPVTALFSVDATEPTTSVRNPKQKAVNDGETKSNKKKSLEKQPREIDDESKLAVAAIAGTVGFLVIMVATILIVLSLRSRNWSLRKKKADSPIHEYAYPTIAQVQQHANTTNHSAVETVVSKNSTEPYHVTTIAVCHSKPDPNVSKPNLITEPCAKMQTRSEIIRQKKLINEAAKLPHTIREEIYETPDDVMFSGHASDHVIVADVEMYNPDSPVVMRTEPINRPTSRSYSSPVYYELEQGSFEFPAADDQCIDSDDNAQVYSKPNNNLMGKAECNGRDCTKNNLKCTGRNNSVTCQDTKL